MDSPRRRGQGLDRGDFGWGPAFHLKSQSCRISVEQTRLSCGGGMANAAANG